MDSITKEEKAIIRTALEAHKNEIKKLMTKAEKLGLKEAENLKRTFLSVESLRAKLVEEV